MQPDAQFWEDSSRWPRDTTTHVFLARAVDAVGRATFKEEWTGREAVTRLPHFRETIPNMPSLNTGKPGFVERLTLPPVGTFALPENLDTRELMLAAIGRFGSSCRRIANAAADRTLSISARPRNGGALYPIPAEWWNTERWRPRFHFCQIDVKEPFSFASTGVGARWWWLFVEKASLAKVLGPPAERPSGAAGRPSKMADVRDELMRRIAAGELLALTVSGQSRDLEGWFKSAFPNEKDPPKAGAIENGIRAIYNEAKLRARGLKDQE